MFALVIADDLTGAMDTGVAFAQCGFRTAVSACSGIPDDIGKTDVLCVNAGSRHLPPRQAYEEVFRLTKAASLQDIPCVFKKTDSALRGNVGAELAAMKDALGMEVLPFVPAYPALGRTVRDGVLYISGMPADRTALGHDPFNPLPSSSIDEILRATAPEFKGIQVYDAVTEDDLRQAADLLSGAVLRSAGCGGFAKIVAERLLRTLPDNLRKTSDRQSKEKKPPHGSGFLIVCGSLHETSLLQVQTAAAEGVPGHVLLQESPASLVRNLSRELEDPGISILCTSDYTAVRSDILHPAAAASGSFGFKVVSSLTRIVSELAKAGRVGTLCVFGGDTLAAIMQSLEVTMIYIDRELYPGIVSGQISFRGQHMRLISKAGSFGDPALIRNLRNDLSA